MSLQDEMREDNSFRKVYNAVNNLDSECEMWSDELMSLHARRALRALNSSGLLQSSVQISIEADLDNQSIRSRAVEIQMKAFRLEASIDSKVSDLKKLLAVRYARSLKQKYSSVNERKQYIDAVCQPMIKVVTNLKNVYKLAELVVADCDAAGYTMKRIGDVLALKSKDR